MRALTYQRRSCLISDSTVRTVVYPVDNDGNSIDDLVQTARARVEPPTPSITRLPSLDGGNAVVVQNPLWVWTTDPVTETATAGNGVQVSVTSQLQDMTFTLTGSDYTEQWTCDPTQVQVSGDGLSLDQYRQPNNYNACHTYIRHSSTGERNNTFTSPPPPPGRSPTASTAPAHSPSPAPSREPTAIPSTPSKSSW